MTLKFSTGLPNCREGRLSPIGSVTIDGMQHIAQVADELGYYSLWPNEIFTGRADVAENFTALPSLFDAVVTMSYAAAVTRNIRLTSSTIVLPLHEPIVLSRQIATLDVFSGGRVTLGVGLGGKAEEYRSLHANERGVQRGDMMDEYIQALRLLWTAPSATFAGRYAAFKEVETHTKPVQEPLPIFVAGKSNGALKRAANVAQGWIVSKILPDELSACLAKLNTFKAEAGRADDTIEVARQFYVSVGESEQDARDNLHAVIPPSKPKVDADASHSKAEKQEEIRLVGTPAQITRRLEDYAAAGVTEFAIIFFYPDPKAGEQQLRLFAREVMPAFA